MQTAGLVEPKAGVVFQGWHVQTGPIYEQDSEVWAQIETEITKNNVDMASFRLRRHLEYISAELADQLGAQPTFRGDGSYELSDLLPAVIRRHGELLGQAAKSANAWKNAEATATVAEMKGARSEALKKHGDENWIVNKAIHWNEWAAFSKTELREVVEAFKGLLAQFRCPKPECDSWLYVTPSKASPDALRCPCMSVNLNLKTK